MHGRQRGPSPRHLVRGHPDWEPLPVEEGAPAASVAKNQALAIERSIRKRQGSRTPARGLIDVRDTIR